MTEVFVPTERLQRWVENFGSRHGEFSLAIEGGALLGAAADGASFRARAPFGSAYAGPAEGALFAQSCAAPARWGVLLVRKGGFAIARLTGDRLVESKVGKRHVQGRTKAGGQSQQRFARRRDNQARAAYEAAAEHAQRILTGPLTALVCGGDRTAIEEVLSDPRLRALAKVRVDPWLPVPDPRRGVLEQAVRDASAVAVTVLDTA